LTGVKHLICNAVADTFEIASTKKYHPVFYTELFLQSQTAIELQNLNPTIYCQSPLYHFNSLEMELKASGKKVVYSKEEYTEEMYWAGYLFMYWLFKEDVSPKELCDSYDILGILQNYDVLHTVSCDVAIDKIKNPYGTNSNPKSKTELLKSDVKRTIVIF